MADLSTWLDTQSTTLHEPLPDPAAFDFDDLNKPPQTSIHTLTTAIEKLIVATAALHRAGPWYVSKSEAIWHFIAGSLPRAEHDSKVSKALAKLPKRVSMERDVAYAEEMMLEAVVTLKRDGDARDAGDLMECLRDFGKAPIR